ncbi:MAG: large subunit ribosomal protein L9 [Candidatus Paceibacteria bacterium]|jgi:large subunit ribosomal protein L9
MQETEILLREHVKHLGRCGDIVRVKPGYARNYLIPKGIGIQATEDNKNAMARRRTRLDAEEEALFAEFDKRIADFAKIRLVSTQRTDDHGRLYGSVSPMMIVGLLDEAGEKIDEKDVRLASPIKTVGTHEVIIHLHAERSGVVSLEVKAEGADEAAAEEETATEEGVAEEATE